MSDNRLEIIEIRKRPLVSAEIKTHSAEREKEAPIAVPERLTSPHPLVRSTIDALVERDRRHQTCVKILDETIEIELREGLNRSEKQFTAAELREREKSSWLRDRKENEFYPSANFVFTILEYCGEGLRKVWSDGKRQRLENCLNSIIAGLRAAAEGEKALRLRREQRERERQEEQRRRWEEEERRRKEEEKIKHLEKLVANWNQSRRIREFLSEVEKAAAENPANKTDNLSDWLSWAHAYADSVDPIHLTFHSRPRPENEA
jgi:hypothetical protein